MIFNKRIVIADNERGLLFKEKQLQRVLTPGVYREFDPRNRLSVTVFDVSLPEVTQSRIQALLRAKPALAEAHFLQVNTDENTVALIRINGQLRDVAEPQTQKWFWKDTADIEVTHVNISENPEISVALMNRLRKAIQTSVLRKGVFSKQVAHAETGLLFIDGVFVKSLKAGAFAFWNFNQSIEIKTVDTRAQTMEVSGQEILTRDKVSLRVNLSAGFKVTDVQQAVSELADFQTFLYTELQLALRKAIGTKTLDTLLSDKEAIDAIVGTQVSKRINEFGLKLLEVGVKDIILPGEMKNILNQVVEAEKAAKANIIKRREETAATRSLLNTAKLMDESPTLKRLKELETLEKIADKVENLTVFGGMESVINDTVKINVN
ncbi:slipin family protein [Marinicella sp. W31]|uniref:slipin family protein n=1 Tax=Marinicella sp. W31 TaxID=3023713 RepID=UPI0037579437